MRRAQESSAFALVAAEPPVRGADSGRQVKMRALLGVSPGAGVPNGPVMVTDWMCGRPVQSSVSTELRRNCCRRLVSASGR
jgi:hypothetical protein